MKWDYELSLGNIGKENDKSRVDKNEEKAIFSKYITLRNSPFSMEKENPAAEKKGHGSVATSVENILNDEALEVDVEPILQQVVDEQYDLQIRALGKIEDFGLRIQDKAMPSFMEGGEGGKRVALEAFQNLSPEAKKLITCFERPTLCILPAMGFKNLQMEVDDRRLHCQDKTFVTPLLDLEGWNNDLDNIFIFDGAREAAELPVDNRHATMWERLGAAHRKFKNIDDVEFMGPEYLYFHLLHQAVSDSYECLDNVHHFEGADVGTILNGAVLTDPSKVLVANYWPSESGRRRIHLGDRDKVAGGLDLAFRFKVLGEAV